MGFRAKMRIVVSVMDMRASAAVSTAGILCACMLLIGAVVAPVAAASQDNELQNLMTQLHDVQKPTEYALFKDYSAEDGIRHKIFDLVGGMSEKPATPPEFDELVGAATYQFKNAHSISDFLAAGGSFNRASLLAPWVPDVYFNGGMAFEKGQAIEAALRWFNLYLASAPNAPDASQVRQKIGALKFAEQHGNPAAQNEYLQQLRPKFFGEYSLSTCSPCTFHDVVQAPMARLKRFTITVQDDAILVTERGAGDWYKGVPSACAVGVCLFDWTDTRSNQKVYGTTTNGTCEGRSYDGIVVSPDSNDILWGGRERHKYLLFAKPNSWC